MPITLGILAQSRQAAVASDFVLLETQVLTGSQASIVFSNLNSSYGATYKHLQIRASARTTRAANGDTGNLHFNGVTTSIYPRHLLQGNGSTVSSDSILSQPNINNGYALVGANATADTFTGIVIDVLDAFSTSKNKTVRMFSGQAANENLIRLGSGFYPSTDATTSLTLSAIGSFAANSRFSLYGVR